MSVSILRLSDGNASLEYEPADQRQVGAAIRALYGKPVIEWAATFARVSFGQCRFVSHDEWDAPYLISTCPAGARMLDAIAARCAGAGSSAAERS